MDLETRPAQLTFQLAPAIKMNLHARDSAVGHPAVTQIGPLEESLPGLSAQPAPALGVPKIEPEIMDVERQTPTAPEDAPGFP